MEIQTAGSTFATNKVVHLLPSPSRGPRPRLRPVLPAQARHALPRGWDEGEQLLPRSRRCTVGTSGFWMFEPRVSQQYSTLTGRSG